MSDKGSLTIDVDDSDSLSLSEGNSSWGGCDDRQKPLAGFLVDVENFVPLGFPGVADKPVAPPPSPDVRHRACAC